MSTTRDILLDQNHDIAVRGQDLQLVADKPAIAQSIGVRLQFFLGEWFLDTTKGLPLTQKVLIKSPNAAVLNSVYRTEILGTPGVKELSSLNLVFDRQGRKLSGTFEATSDVGALVGTLP